MDYYTWSAQVLFCSCTLLNWAVKKGWQIRCPKALHYNSKYVPALHYDCSHRHADVSKGKEEDSGEITNQPTHQKKQCIIYFIFLPHHRPSCTPWRHHRRTCTTWGECRAVLCNHQTFCSTFRNRSVTDSTEVQRNSFNSTRKGWREDTGYMEGRHWGRAGRKKSGRNTRMERRHWGRAGRKKSGIHGWKEGIAEELEGRNQVGIHGWKEGIAEELEGRNQEYMDGKKALRKRWKEEIR